MKIFKIIIILLCINGCIKAQHIVSNPNGKNFKDIVSIDTLNGEQLNFETTYHMFFISDKNCPIKTTWKGILTDEDIDNRLAIEDKIVVVGTDCYGPVNCKISIMESKPKVKFKNYCDHIVEGHLHINSDTLEITNTDAKVVFSKKMSSGDYRVRFYSFNIGKSWKYRVDYYFIEIWPDSKKGVKVIKMHKWPKTKIEDYN